MIKIKFQDELIAIFDSEEAYNKWVVTVDPSAKKFLSVCRYGYDETNL